MAQVFPEQQVVHHVGTNVIEELNYHVKQNNNNNVNKVLLKRYRQKQFNKIQNSRNKWYCLVYLTNLSKNLSDDFLIHAEGIKYG